MSSIILLLQKWISKSNMKLGNQMSREQEEVDKAELYTCWSEAKEKYFAELLWSLFFAKWIPK